ncbi:NAD(P)/FAD-dependent oxidoreductase [Actinoplanes sp. NPDC020271]|uniref:NAD(P)/FAD-dependent oxidoreductase n=1 Tax=Actinoplanes sp. NPDC020271 TaxID=3363896 RepID=UPI0037A8B33B
MSTKVLVVGSGIIGKSIALRLAESGHRVVCVGPDPMRAGTASTAAGAMLGVLGEVTDDASSGLDAAELRFRFEAGRRYPEFLDRIARRSGVQVPLTYGTVIIATGANVADAANLRAIEKAADKLGLRHERTVADHRVGVRPAVGHEPTAATFLPDEGFVDTGRLMDALHQALAASPEVTLIDAEVAAVETDGSVAMGARLDDGTVVSADHVVLANGVGVQPLLDALGLVVGTLPRLLPGKGVSLLVEGVTDPFPYVIRTPNRDFACGSHVVPRGSGTLYVGATNRVSATPGSSQGVTPGEVHALLHSVMHEVNVGIRVALLASTRYGLRPLSSDRYPLIGSTALSGLSIATGTYRNGILMAPLVADIIHEHLTSSTPTLTNPFSPSASFRTRPASPRTEDVLDEGLRHLVSFLLEPGGSMPYDRRRELLAFLSELSHLAFVDSPETKDRRARIQQTLADYPVAEMVPQLFYELSGPKS